MDRIWGMKNTVKLTLQLLAAGLLLSTSMLNGESKKAADYPIRIRIYSKDSTNFYYGRVMEESKGEGRGNIFEGDDLHGVDFSYSCAEKLKANFGYQTYPAKWKKQDKVLTVLLPVFGKTNTFYTCDLSTDIKDYVYVRQKGILTSEPAEKFKGWMIKHDYDPVHGKNDPMSLSAAEKAEEQKLSPPPSAGATPAPSAEPAPMAKQ
jgi:hypothetical protein